MITTVYDNGEVRVGPHTALLARQVFTVEDGELVDSIEQKARRFFSGSQLIDVLTSILFTGAYR